MPLAPPTNPQTAQRALLAATRRYAGQHLVVGVSGGADSVALLRALLLVGAVPYVVHVNHQLREAASADEAWVAALCERLNVPYTVRRIPVADIARKNGWTLEEAARRVRYQALTQVAQRQTSQRQARRQPLRRQGSTGIVTAHTQNDQAETVLWQVLRGELPLGIPARRGALERPWLGITRAQIVAALRGWGQDWREDESNADTRFTRNFIRHVALPTLEQRFGGLNTTLSRLAHWTAQDEQALQNLSHLNSHTPTAPQPRAVLRRWVRRQLAQARAQPHAEHLQVLTEALATGQTVHVSLPRQQEASVTGGRLIVPGEVPITPRPDFDYPAHWVLRHWHPGNGQSGNGQNTDTQSADTMQLAGGQRKLSDILGDLKVPRQWRSQLWLLAEGSAVQWLGTQPERWAIGARQQVQLTPRPLSDEDYMGLALELARSAAQQQEVAIGAVVVRSAHTPQAQIVAQAANRSRATGDMTRHAELEAVQAACQVVGPYLTGCTLYVTLEPCPMCLGAILEARVGRVVFGASNPKAGALGGVHDLLLYHWGHKPQVRAGVRATEAARLLQQGFAAVRSRQT